MGNNYSNGKPKEIIIYKDMSRIYAKQIEEQINKSQVEKRIQGHSVRYARSLFPMYKFRIAAADNIYFPVYQDLHTDRINVHVHTVSPGNQIITHIVSIG